MKTYGTILKIASAILLCGSLGSAHEGHDEAPGVVKANHGGVVQSGRDINLEFVVQGNEISIYPVSHEGADRISDVKLSATSKIPKGKAEVLKIENKAGVFKAKIDFKGAYRSEIVVSADVLGKKDTFKFQVEK